MSDKQQRLLLTALHGIWMLQGMARKLGVAAVEQRAEKLLAELCEAFPGLRLE